MDKLEFNLANKDMHSKFEKGIRLIVNNYFFLFKAEQKAIVNISLVLSCFQLYVSIQLSFNMQKLQKENFQTL